MPIAFIAGWNFHSINCTLYERQSLMHRFPKTITMKESDSDSDSVCVSDVFHVIISITAKIHNDRKTEVFAQLVIVMFFRWLKLVKYRRNKANEVFIRCALDTRCSFDPTLEGRWTSDSCFEH